MSVNFSIDGVEVEAYLHLLTEEQISDIAEYGSVEDALSSGDLASVGNYFDGHNIYSGLRYSNRLVMEVEDINNYEVPINKIKIIKNDCNLISLVKQIINKGDRSHADFIKYVLIVRNINRSRYEFAINNIDIPSKLNHNKLSLYIVTYPGDSIIEKFEYDDEDVECQGGNSRRIDFVVEVFQVEEFTR